MGHCWMSGWQSIGIAFSIWCDLMTDKFEDYALRYEDNPFKECYEWFWVSLGEDETYPKAFLEHLLEMVDRIDRGEEELIPFDEDLMNRLQDLVKDIELDEDT